MTEKFTERHLKTTTTTTTTSSSSSSSSFRDVVIISAVFILVSVLVDVFGLFGTFQEWVREQPRWAEWRIHDYLFVLVILALALGVFSLRRWIELRREIAERKRTEQALLDLKIAVEQSVEGIAKADMEGHIVFANPAWARMHGYDISEITGKHLSIFHTPEQIERDVIPFNKMVEEHGSHQGEVGHVRKDGSPFLTWMSTTVIKDERHNLVGMIGAAIDITERSRVEKALQESEAKYRIVADNTFNWEFWINPEGQFVYSSPSCKRITGHDASEFIEDSTLLHRIIHPDDQQRFITHRREAEQHAIVQETTFRFVHADGTIRWIGHSCQPAFDDDGHFLGTRGSNYDITDRKRTEEALQESEHLYRTLAEAAHDAIFVINKEGYYEYINSFAAEQLGRRPEEIIGKRREDIFPPYIVDQIERQEIEIFTTGKSAHFEDEVFLSGHTAWFSTRIVPIKNEFGEINAIMGVARDITERKRMEETLKKSEMQLSVAQEVASLGSWDADLVSNTVSWSPQLYRLLDIDPQECAASLEGFAGSVHPDDREKVKHLIERALTNGKSFEFEHRGIHRNGTVKNLWAKGFISHDESGRPTRVFGIEQDITERKRAEEALRESEERFRSVAQSATDAVIVANSKGNIISWNNAAQTIFGYGEEEALGKPLTLLMPERFHDSHRRGLERFLSAGKSDVIGKTVELAGRKKDGNEFPLEVSLAGWKTGKETSFTGIIRDITERKRAEEALRRSEERYRRITDGLTDYLYTVRVENGQPVGTTHSHACVEVTGYAAEGFTANPNLWIEMVVPQDRDMVRSHAHKVLSREDAPSIEHRIVRKDGEIRWVRDTAILNVDSSGKLVSYDGVIRDITERKRAEAEREKLIAELQQALDNVKTLGGLIPICANCKKIRDDKGYWTQVEKYVMDHSDATFSHGVCPECMQKLYPEYYQKIKKAVDGES